jgi:hypothetical protein
MIKYSIYWKDFYQRKSFIDLESRNSKNIAADYTHDALKYFSGSYNLNKEAADLNIGLLLNCYISKYNIIVNSDPGEKLKRLLTNIKDWIEVAPNKDKDKFKSLVIGIFTKEELREFGFKIGKSKFNQLKSFKDNLAANLREDKVIKRKRLSCDLLKKYLTFIKSDIQA